MKSLSNFLSIISFVFLGLGFNFFNRRSTFQTYSTDQKFYLISIGIIVGVIGLLVRYKHLFTEQQSKDNNANHILEVINSLKKPNLYSLYLRPFNMDGLINVKKEWGETSIVLMEESHYNLESVFSKVLKTNYPLIGLGKSIGIGRVKQKPEDIDDWKDLFIKLVLHAKIVFIIPSFSTGTFYELNYLIQNNHLSKTYFIQPPCSRKNLEKIRNEWSEMRFWLKERGILIAAFNKNGQIFKLDSMNKIGDQRIELESLNPRALRFLFRNKFDLNNL